MKKILTLLLIFFVTTTCCYALSKPRWDKRPIKVYIPQHSTKSQMMKSAFEEWQKKTFSAVWFVFVGENKKHEADISVKFVDIVTNCNNSSAVGCAHYTLNPEGFYKKTDLYIGAKSVYTLEGDDGTVATKTVPIPQAQMYGIMLHEIGHAIGVIEHSNNINSIMYPYTMYDYNIPQHLTEDDLKLIYKTYR